MNESRHEGGGRKPGLRELLASRDFLRLWAIGGTVNAMRWTEMLAAALFTFQVTGSGWAVAVVSAMRTLPMLLFGAVAGVVAESVNRKTILQVGLVLNSLAAGWVCALGWLGVLAPWHIGVAAFAGGLVWASEMATRRRMCGEAAGPELMPRAVALDSLTNATTRGIGPLVGSFAFASLGATGAYAISAVCYAGAAMIVPGIRHTQEVRRLVLGRVPRELAEGLAYARTQPTVLAVLGVTIAMNMFAFTYIAVVAPLAIGVFGVSPSLAGVLASAEPVGSLIGGLALASGTVRGRPRVLMVAGSAVFLVALAVMPLIPNYWVASAVLLVGGVGLALFGNMQTTLVLTGVPPSVRSRQMGLITVCIGAGPLGQLLIGALSEGLGPRWAVMTSAMSGLVVLAAVGIWWARAERRKEG
ncbi:MAG: MFS transporter [Acetobacteraceae bacterium]|nr:MFS transporter [Acetobacteraceae bacterium]